MKTKSNNFQKTQKSIFHEGRTLFFSETPGRSPEIPARIEAIESDQAALENTIKSLVAEVKERLNH
jgi:hypothetical protein